MRPSSRAFLVSFSAAAITLGASNARAQRPPGADTLSDAAIAESLSVLKGLREHLKKNKNDAAAWYRRGMIAWALFDRDRVRGGYPGLDWTLLGREAEAAIRTASAIEPKNIRYAITMGQYFLGTGWIFVRIQSYIVFDNALTAARASGDSALIAEAAVEQGRVHWRRYDPSSFGVVPASVTMRARQVVSDSALSRQLLSTDPYTPDRTRPFTRRSLKQARDLLDAEFNPSSGGFVGEAEYIKAEGYFREALNAMPSYTRAYQQLAMLFADRARWSELAGLARTRVQAAPNDAWAWMTLGLASHRLGDATNASAAFAKGFAALAPGERQRLDHLRRVLRPSDTLAFIGMSPEERAVRERMFWLMSDPLWGDDGAEPRTEFLARVAFAELRWTVEELSKRGADSDRGNIHIRYGPPDARARQEGGGETWWYDFAQMRFTFDGAPTFATAYFADPTYASLMIDSVPARWDNIADVRIDTLPANVARFRAGQDSVDVFFATRPPVEEIRHATDIATSVRSDFWLLRDGTHPVIRDSAMESTSVIRTWTQRVALGNYLYRFEARAEGSLVAGRATAALVAGTDSATGFATSGFGMSDLLLASTVEGTGGTAARWNNVRLTPLAGPVVGNKELVVVWENYDFGERGGNAEYDLSITIRRERSETGRLSARIIGGIREVLGRAVTNDRVELELDRQVAHSPTLVDQVTISLGDTPTGTYILTLNMTDRVTGRTASRTTRIAVR